ncbi:lytic transglycosylase domain-containing protein [Oligoflexia bacterium]|nr:lytic transglycosylase domain-containing protein [Oligoflexia bacterium]
MARILQTRFYFICTMMRIYLLLLLLLFLPTGCVYRSLVDLDNLNFSNPLESKAVQHESLERVDLSKARGRYFMPTKSRPVLPPPDLKVTWEVKQELRYFEQRDPQYVPGALKRRAEYYPMMVEVFRDEGVPIELINLAMIESGFRPKAKSRAGAVGMWQFMKSTGRVYGLKIGFFEDQRKDPVLSTLAAARHLRDLYFVYKDWHLVLAAYNAGTTRLDRSLNHARTKDFWELSRKGQLPRQTRRFVPRFIAATLLVKREEAQRKRY